MVKLWTGEHPLSHTHTTISSYLLFILLISDGNQQNVWCISVSAIGKVLMCNSAFPLGSPPPLEMPGSYSNRMYCVEHYTSELFCCSLSRKPALSIISQPLGEKEMKGRTGIMMMLVPYSCYLCFWLILVGVGGGILLSGISLAK